MTRHRSGSSARRAALVLIAILATVVSACADPQTGSPAPTASIVTSTSSTVSTTTTTSTGAASETTTPDASLPPTSLLDRPFSMATYSAGAIESLAGSDGMLGSGCTPGPGPLPDGAWLGFVTRAEGRLIGFDLACAEAGDPVVVTNTNPNVRDVALAEEITVFGSDGAQKDFVSWSPPAGPVWVFINDGVASEIAGFAMPVSVRTTTENWAFKTVSLPVSGGCCGELYSGPASPREPWPTTGLPADGVYEVDVLHDAGADDLMLTIMRFVPCAQRPEWCYDDADPEEMVVDHTDVIARRVALDDDMTVRIIGLDPDVDLGFLGIEGNGALFGDLLDQTRLDHEAHIERRLREGVGWSDLYDELVQQGEQDPDFPYGRSVTINDLVYRGPLGVELFGWAFGQPHLGAAQLEIVGGRPILTIHAGMIAG